MAPRTRSGPITALPAGWSLEVLDQGEQIDEVWLRIEGPKLGQRSTKVFQRSSSMGEALLELALAQ